MTPRKGAKAIPARQPRLALAWLCALAAGGALAVGCGVPGEPVPPSPPIPVSVTDLTATQRGDGVLLIFTPPNKSTRSERLNTTPTMEVLRGSLRPDGLPDTKSFRLIDTVPSAILSTYIQGGKVRFPEHFSPEEMPSLLGKTSVFLVRTRVSERKSSADSNKVMVTLYPVPERIEKIETHEAENSIQLSWTPPTQTSSGEPISGPLSYQMYRGELDPASQAVGEKDLHAAVWQSPLVPIAAVKAPGYEDRGFDYGKTYVYVVRSVVTLEGKTLESDDSRPVILTPKDIFPPAAPQDIVAAVLPSAQTGRAVVDLSWAINVETDLGGYRVYRSERESERGQLLTPALLPSPAYRDSDVVAGRRYWYTVTAVDHAGNESAPSAPTLVEVP